MGEAKAKLNKVMDITTEQWRNNNKQLELEFNM